MNAKDLRRLRALHAMLGSDNEKEALSARKKILAILKRRNKTWNDLPNSWSQRRSPASILATPSPRHRPRAVLRCSISCAPC
jgi:hypothetical protein